MQRMIDFGKKIYISSAIFIIYLKRYIGLSRAVTWTFARKLNVLMKTLHKFDRFEAQKVEFNQRIIALVSSNAKSHKVCTPINSFNA